jgi:prepilin-type N-terminal cleavage/methylation domain-containing protein
MDRTKHTRAFTLVEAMVALVILGVAVAAILTPINVAIQQKTRAMKQTLAVLLAEQLIEECVSKSTWSYDAEWPTLGPSAGETWRNVYDERSDYHNVTETADKFGTVKGPRLAAADFPPNMTRRMWAQYLYLPGERDFYTYDVMMLTVRVYDGNEELVTLRRLITNPDHVYP